MNVRNFADYFIGSMIGQDIWKCQLHPKDVNFVKDPFWRDMLHAWAEYNFSGESTGDEIIWYNSKIKIGGKTIAWKKLYEKGLTYVSQLWQQGHTFTADSVREKYEVGWMEQAKLISAVPQKLRNLEDRNTKYEKLVQSTNISRTVYAEQTFDLAAIAGMTEKWNTTLKEAWSERESAQHFRNIYLVTNVAKFRSFQFRLLHRAVITNVHLYHRKILNNNMCSFCKKEKEMYIHLFVYCENVKRLWIQLEEMMMRFSDRQIDFSVKTVMLNQFVVNPGDIKNFLCLSQSNFIYRKRCLKEEIDFEHLKNYIKEIENIKKYNAQKKNVVNKHMKKWYGYRNFMHENNNTIQNYIMNI